MPASNTSTAWNNKLRARKTRKFLLFLTQLVLNFFFSFLLQLATCSSAVASRLQTFFVVLCVLWDDEWNSGPVLCQVRFEWSFSRFRNRFFSSFFSHLVCSRQVLLNQILAHFVLRKWLCAQIQSFRKSTSPADFFNEDKSARVATDADICTFE